MALASLCATASFAQQVKTDFDRSIGFSQYKTYSFIKVNTQNPLWVDRIKAAVISALAAKGWMQVDSGGDVAITAMEMTKDHRTLNTYYDNFGGGWGWRRFGGFGDSTTTEHDYKVGTLVVDMYDAKSKQLIWRGSLEDTPSPPTAETVVKGVKSSLRLGGFYRHDGNVSALRGRSPAFRHQLGVHGILYA